MSRPRPMQDVLASALASEGYEVTEIVDGVCLLEVRPGRWRWTSNGSSPVPRASLHRIHRPRRDPRSRAASAPWVSARDSFHPGPATEGMVRSPPAMLTAGPGCLRALPELRVFCRPLS